MHELISVSLKQNAQDKLSVFIALIIPMSLKRQNRVQQRLPRFLESHLHSAKIIQTILSCAFFCSSFRSGLLSGARQGTLLKTKGLFYGQKKRLCAWLIFFTAKDMI